MKPLSLLVAGLGLASHSLLASSLIIASYRNTIEHTPQQIALEDYWSGADSIILNLGVPNMTANATIDLAGNAQTQALRAFPASRNLRIIYTLVEVVYRLVASRSSGVSTLADLRGKRIGTFVNTSGQYFIQKLLAGAGVLEDEYVTVNGSMCSAEPCGNGTLVDMLDKGEIDAIGIWEPTLELAVQRLGDDAVVFRDPTAYKELYNIHSTTEKLADPVKRAEIVSFIRAVHKAQKVFATRPEDIWPRVSGITGVSQEVLEGVWDDHDWEVTLTENMLQLLVEEEQWIAKLQKRNPLPESELAKLIDPSVVADALRPGGCRRRTKA